MYALVRPAYRRKCVEDLVARPGDPSPYVSAPGYAVDMSALILRYRAIRQLAFLIFDGPAGYRTARELEVYFMGLGHIYAVQPPIRRSYAYIRTESRIEYVTRVIEQMQELGQLEHLLAQFGQSAPSLPIRRQLQSAISEILSPYGQRLDGDPETGVFQVVSRAPQGTPPTPAQLSVPEFRRDQLSPEEVALLEARWLEAVTMYQAGALRMTILALSAILEHVLMARARCRPDEAQASPFSPEPHLPVRDWTFDTLLAVAAEQDWISGSPQDFPYRVRQYRRHLSPRQELQEGPLLNDDLSHEVWRSVRQALDDLSVV